MPNSLPLLELFTRLRDAGLPLGVGEYQLVLKALQGGFGLGDRTSLQRLCETLWTKTDEEKRLLDHHFKQLMPPELESVAPSVVESQRLKRFPVRPAYLAVAALLLGTAVAVGVVHLNRQTVAPIVVPAPGEEGEPEPGIPDPPDTPAAPPPEVGPSEGIATEPVSEWVRWLIVGAIALSSSLLLAWWVSRLLLKRSPPTKLAPDKFSTATQAISDEIEAAQAERRSKQHQQKRLLPPSDYLPITQRQMKRSWRYLSRPVREGLPTELDVDATIQRISQQGLFLEPVLVPPRTNRAALLLLVDQEGSMIPFHKLTERLVATAQRGGRFGTTHVYYFHNCPMGYLYRDAICLEEERLEDVFEHLPLRQLSTLIVSDAGAVRQGYSPYRIEKTQAFLTFLYQRVRHAAWLNPIPKERWPNTTAAEIAKDIPMFGCDRPGLDSAIEVLRGRKGRGKKGREKIEERRGRVGDRIQETGDF